MDWHKKSLTTEEFNSAKYQNTLNEIRRLFNENPEKQKEFAVFKEDFSNNNHLLYFSPTSDPKFLSILTNELEAEPCDKPNLNNAKLILGRFV